MGCCKNKCNCKAILSTVGLILGYFIFLLFGGFMFVLIEKAKDEELKNSRRHSFLDVLAKHNISANNTVIKEIVEAAISANEVNGIALNDYTQPTLTDWNLGSSVFFSGTIVTTIGYGNIHPRTTWGKVFCIIFATVGIPFTGIVLGKMGLGLTNLIKTADSFIENRIKQCFPKASAKDNMKSHVRSIQLSFVVVMFVLIFLLVPAAIMSKTEDEWKFFDSFYFCFISLSTIGLGDLTPGASVSGIEFTKRFQWKVFKKTLNQASVMLYLLTGLAALSIILTLVSSMMKSAAEKTLKGGTGLMSEGKAMMDAKGQQLVGGARRFASSFRQKAASAMHIGKTTSVDIDEEEASFNDPSSLEKAPVMIDGEAECLAMAEMASNRRYNQPEVDGNPDEIVLENDDACSCDTSSHEMVTSQTVLSQGDMLIDRSSSARHQTHGLNDSILSNSKASDMNTSDQNGSVYVVPKRLSSQSLPTAEG